MNNQNQNPIYGMTEFELEVMNDFLFYNETLFAFRKEDIQAYTDIANKIIIDNLMTIPNIQNMIEPSYIDEVAQIVDEIRSEYPYSKTIIKDIITMLNQYYGTIFSKLGMVNADENISSDDLCINYYNCKIAKEALENYIKTKQTRYS